MTVAAAGFDSSASGGGGWRKVSGSVSSPGKGSCPAIPISIMAVVLISSGMGC